MTRHTDCVGLRRDARGRCRAHSCLLYAVPLSKSERADTALSITCGEHSFLAVASQPTNATPPDHADRNDDARARTTSALR